MQHQSQPPTSNVVYRMLEEELEADSPEAIAKWRESRKRNFPTPKNIEKKVEEKADTILRGEKFLPKRLNRKVFNYPIKVENGRDRGRNRRPPFVNTSWVNQNLPQNKSEVLLLDSYYMDVSVDPSGILIRGRHTHWDTKMTESEVDEEDVSSASALHAVTTNPNPLIAITDDEEDIMPSLITNGANQKISDYSAVQKTTVHNLEGFAAAPFSSKAAGLQALVAYSSDTDLEDGEIDEAERPEEIRTAVAAASAARIPLPCQESIVRPTSASPSQPSHSESSTTRQSQKRHKKKKPEPNQPSSRIIPGRHRMRRSDREPTLLRRLLDDEICEERNAILCAGRFLTQHNFLEGIEDSEDVRAEFIDCVRNSSSMGEDKPF